MDQEEADLQRALALRFDLNLSLPKHSFGHLQCGNCRVGEDSERREQFR